MHTDSLRGIYLIAHYNYYEIYIYILQFWNRMQELRLRIMFGNQMQAVFKIFITYNIL